ncbi:small subunit ribosomal protein S6 [Ardenticatena maritima]|uniref:Small ribosomal subunit protein bS6 n=1 Tax=Ardenticatena maritima TaxID=872965 RepID=A0A0M9UBD8_9CHLR|nr:30S ribosomal protein S6 [Ardenticatena maritima]GAP61647.1 small subunit ribosomal protein S6 [Ardenticatena maritima]
MSNIRRYELYIVLRPDLDDEQREAFIESLNAFVGEQAGQIISTQRLGKRRLAYPIQHLLEGYDVLYELLLPAPAPNAIEARLRLSENVLRYLLVRRDDLPLDAGAVEAVARQAEEKAQADATAAEAEAEAAESESAEATEDETTTEVSEPAVAESETSEE